MTWTSLCPHCHQATTQAHHEDFACPHCDHMVKASYFSDGQYWFLIATMVAAVLFLLGCVALPTLLG